MMGRKAEVQSKLFMDSSMVKVDASNNSVVNTTIADSKYGTVNNYLSCNDRGINSHFQSLESSSRGTGRQKGIFPKEDFIFHSESNTFTCLAGNTLMLRKYNKHRSHYEYICPKSICSKCHLKSQCTRSKTRRTLKRHIRQSELDLMLNQANSKPHTAAEVKVAHKRSIRVLRPICDGLSAQLYKTLLTVK